jgi:hypothetical protein
MATSLCVIAVAAAMSTEITHSLLLVPSVSRASFQAASAMIAITAGATP